MAGPYRDSKAITVAEMQAVFALSAFQLAEAFQTFFILTDRYICISVFI